MEQLLTARSICCLGALSEWLSDHPVMINNVLPLVLQALGNPELSISSVSTLKKICRECKYDLPPYAANIVAVSQVTCENDRRTLVQRQSQYFVYRKRWFYGAICFGDGNPSWAVYFSSERPLPPLLLSLPVFQIHVHHMRCALQGVSGCCD